MCFCGENSREAVECGLLFINRKVMRTVNEAQVLDPVRTHFNNLIIAYIMVSNNMTDRKNKRLLLFFNVLSRSKMYFSANVLLEIPHSSFLTVVAC